MEYIENSFEIRRIRTIGLSKQLSKVKIRGFTYLYMHQQIAGLSNCMPNSKSTRVTHRPVHFD